VVPNLFRIAEHFLPKKILWNTTAIQKAVGEHLKQKKVFQTITKLVFCMSLKFKKIVAEHLGPACSGWEPLV
jgi:hypothetical protein